LGSQFYFYLKQLFDTLVRIRVSFHKFKNEERTEFLSLQNDEINDGEPENKVSIVFYQNHHTSFLIRSAFADMGISARKHVLSAQNSKSFQYKSNFKCK